MRFLLVALFLLWLVFYCGSNTCLANNSDQAGVLKVKELPITYWVWQLC